MLYFLLLAFSLISSQVCAMEHCLSTTTDEVKILITRANYGNISAQDRVTNLYRELKYMGLIKPQTGVFLDNIDTQLSDMCRALETQDRQKIAVASLNLACLYSRGWDNMIKNENKAFSYLTLAASQEHALAQIILETIINKQTEDVKRFVHLVTEQAHKGDALAQTFLAGFYLTGFGGVEKNEKKALHFLNLASDQGIAFAHLFLLKMHQKGLADLGKNEKEIAQLLTLVEKGGDARILVFLGEAYEDSNQGLALRLYQIAADRGLPKAQFKLGTIYQYGYCGMAQDDRQALTFLKAAARQNYAPAQNVLGYFHQHGRGGLDKDEVEAVRLYKESASQKHEAAEFNLAWMYQRGLGGLDRDPKETVRIYKLASDRGFAPAQYELGALYYTGRDGLGRDKVEGARLIKLAAEQDYAAAQYNIGFLYKMGSGVEQDYGEALRWWMESKFPAVKKEIYDLLGTPQFLEGNRGSFKDMLDDILGGENTDENTVQDKFEMFMKSWNYKPLRMPLQGLEVLAYTHQTKMQNNKELAQLYEKVTAFEGELLDLITAIKDKSGPGFMIQEFKDRVSNTSLADLKFFCMQPIKVTTDSFFNPVQTLVFYSFGDQNVLLAKDLVKCLSTIDQRWEETDKALKKIAALCDKESYLETEIEWQSLEKIKDKIKALLYFGLSMRTYEFFQEHQWLK